MRLVSKLDLAVITAAVVCGVMWVERGHHVPIDVPSPAVVTLRVAVAACPDNDSVPYAPSCLEFMGGNRAPGRSERASLAETPKHEAPLASDTACPDNDNRPYPPACVRFLSGWFWRAN